MSRLCLLARSMLNHLTSDAEGGDVAALGSYQCRLLLGAGSVLSLVIVVGMAAVLMLHAGSFQARRLEAFERARANIHMYLAEQDARNQRWADMAEYAWLHRAEVSSSIQSAERLRFFEDGERAVFSAGKDSVPQMALGQGTGHWLAALPELTLRL